MLFNILKVLLLFLWFFVEINAKSISYNGNNKGIISNFKGDLSVNSGTLNYSVPLTLPLGTAGVKPQTTLLYSSSGGNGYFGIGWSMTGLSAISRCGSNLALDEKIASIAYDETDHICMDGQRLVLVQGTAWESGSIYHTKTESYSKINYNGSDFIVYTKDGDVKTYHKFRESWLLSRIEDRYENGIDYYYSFDSEDEIYLSHISYADNEIRLQYEDRLDTVSGYANGKKTVLTKKVSKIEIYSNEILLRHYNLNYDAQDTASDKSKIINMTECSGSTCLEPLVFSYDPEESVMTNRLEQWMPIGEGLLTTSQLISLDTSGISETFIDINGDGLADKVINYYNEGTATFFFYKNPVDMGIWIALNNGYGFTPFSKWMASGQGQNTSGYIIGANTSGTYETFMDMNGDGLQDKVIHYNYNTKEYGIWVALNSGHDFGVFSKWMEAGQGQHSNGYLIASNTIGTYETFMDMNGDGLPDKVI
jgi:hypothetical protein